MPTNSKRVMVTIPPEVEKEIDNLKQKKFYDKSYSEMYRRILQVGITQIKEADEKGKTQTA